MKNLTALVVSFLLSFYCMAQTPFISEINYRGSDSGIELTGISGFNLEGWSLLLYKGTSKKVYKTIKLSGAFNYQNNNLGTVWLDIRKLDTGHPKGAAIALVDSNNSVIEFLSYEGSFTPKDGLLKGVLPQSIGVVEQTNNFGESLQKIESGWIYSQNASPNELNTSKTLSLDQNKLTEYSVYPNPVANGEFRIKTALNSEKEVRIFNMFGKQVYNKTVKANQSINVSNLTSGIYFVNVVEEGKTATRKLVIK